MSMKILKPGLLTTIQDLGRFGYQKYGVVVSGAMDTLSFRIANLLVNNDENAPGLEITLSGPAIEWQKDAWIAICGADLSPMIEGSKVPLWRPIYVKKGSVLTFHQSVVGCRCYLAVMGGIQVPRALGSTSTYVRGQIGGFHGRALKRGDSLRIGDHSKGVIHDNAMDMTNLLRDRPFFAVPWFVSSDFWPYTGLSPTEFPPVIRVIAGREYERFSEEGRTHFLTSSFTVDPQSDRMGYRLTGPRIDLSEPLEMISEAVTAGTIQVPPQGNPILLLSDRQTTGGYPRIAQVASVDLPMVAQLKPNELLRFELISHEQAEQLYLAREMEMAQIKQFIQYKWLEILKS